MNAIAKAVSPLRREDAQGIAVLTLDSPGNRNALSESMLGALTATFAAIAEDRSVRAVVLAAKGPAFSSGHDLKELTGRRTDADRGEAYFAAIMERCSNLMQAVVALPQPVIAAVEGVATAAGCQLVATCDLAIAGAEARFCTPGIHIGLFCSTPMVALSRNLAPKHALEMLFTGDVFSVEDAFRFGLVNRMVPAGMALDEALALARKIAAKSAMTVTTGKRAFYEQRDLSLDEAYRAASRVMVANMLARDAAEGIGAFLDKRPPVWEGR